MKLQPASPQSPAPPPSQAVAAPAVYPDVAGAGPAGRPPPRIPPGPPFVLRVHPERWMVMEGLVVPQASKLMYAPGANGVDVNRAGKPDGRQAVAEATAAGWQILPWEVDGPGTSYLVPTGSGAWVTRFETFFPGGEAIVSDSKSYAAWLDGLVRTGKIPEPHDYVLARLEQALIGQAEQYQRQGETGHQRRIADLLASAKVVQARRAELMAKADPLQATPAIPDVQ